MPTLYFFVGYPGSGKTTVANYICEATGAVHIWADRERQSMFNHPTHSQLESNALYKHLNHKTKELLRAGHDVVFDTNFNYRKDRDHMRAIASNSDAKTVIIRVVTPQHIARERALKGTHAERNGMAEAMSAQTFDRIANHLEPLESDEPYTELDGSDIDKPTVLRTLGLA